MSPVAPMWQILFSHLAVAVPNILVYAGGIVLALIWRRRAPRAAMLMLAGLMLMLIVTIGGSTLQAYVLSTQSPSAIGMKISILAFGSSLLRALGMGLMIGAVFADRARVPVTGFDVSAPAPFPPLADLASAQRPLN